jgi:hypothetical protein
MNIKVHPILASIAFVVVSMTVGKAEADTCYYEDQQDLHDKHYSAAWNCQSTDYKDARSRFDMDKSDWDSGFGYTIPCDNRAPMGRTMNALMLMKYAGTNRPTCSTNDGESLLFWAYCWSGKAIDEIDGRCGSGSRHGSTTALTKFGIGDNWTELYWPFFYGRTVVERAAIIFHEARHAQGWCTHGGGSGRCKLGSKSCDTSWESGCTGFNSDSGKGAVAYQVLFLNHFATRARAGWVTKAAREKAIGAANFLLWGGFDKNPCFRLDKTGSAIKSC